MGEFRMPSLGAGMDAGRLLEWYVHPGDEVHRGDIVALVETDKAAIEVEVFDDGVVEELLVEEDAKVPVGTLLARIGDGTSPAPAPDEAAASTSEPDAAVTMPATPPSPPPAPAPAPRPVPAARHDTGATPAAPAPDAAPALDPAPHPTGTDRPRSSPYARRLAQEQDIDLASLTGSGPEGAVVARDVTPPPAGPGRPSTTTPPTVAPSTDEGARDPAAAMRRAIARAMAASKREIPHYYLGHPVDVEQVLRRLETRNADRSPTERVLPAALLLHATARACRDHPDFNGFWTDDRFQPADGVHLGVAISLRGGGLVAPAIHDADHLSLDELMSALTDLVQRARAGRLRGSEVSDPTVTITNLGDRGVERVDGIIYPPQVALVGAGRIAERPWVVDGDVVSRRVIHLSLAADHRATDGHRGALFLASIAHHLDTTLEEPS